MPYLEIPHGRVFYTQYRPAAPASRATLILHHGLGSSHAYYRPITPTLTSAPYNFHCITYDCISSGLSTIATETQSIDSLAEDALDILDKLGVKEKVVFVGHSIAGVVASQLAATKTDRLLGAIMLGPVLPNANAKTVFEERIRSVKKDGMEPLANTIPTGATGSRSTSLHHAMIRSLLLSQKPEGYCSMCNVVAKATPPDYGAIEIPTLLIAGDEDKSAPLAGCEEIFKRTGGKKRMEIEKAVGHWFCIEDPEATAKLVADFADELVTDK